jgi:hypothetical protein
MKYFLLLIVVGAVLAAAETELNEAQVFEWWDDGIIDSDEAREILDLLEEGNTQEACMLAEVYALESCASRDPVPAKTKKNKETKVRQKKPKQESRPSLTPHGFVEWRGRTDSLGHFESQHTEIRIQFYRFTLRLGTQSLLTYKNAGSEAHLGQISTKELHSAIPLDTLWGTALYYPLYSPLGTFRLGGLLDTAKTIRPSIGFSTFRGKEKKN